MISAIHLPISNLPAHYDRSDISQTLKRIEQDLQEKAGIACVGRKEPFALTFDVATNQLMDMTICLRELGLI